jgi:hypothetical protein
MAAGRFRLDENESHPYYRATLNPDPRNRTCPGYPQAFRGTTLELSGAVVYIFVYVINGKHK